MQPISDIPATNFKIGIVSFWYPPSRGGVQVFGERLARLMYSLGIQVVVATSKADAEGFGIRSEPFPVCRLPYADERSTNVSQQRLVEPGDPEWRRKTLDWLLSTDCTHIVMDGVDVPEIREALRQHGKKVGYAVHDYMPMQLAADSLQLHWKIENWDATSDRAVEDENSGRKQYHYHLPLLKDDWDFVVTVNTLTRRLIEKVVDCPIMVLHPPIDENALSYKEVDSSHFTIGAINPVMRKGAVTLAGMLWGSPKRWTYRIILEGWGNAPDTFPQMIEQVQAVPNRVVLSPYLRSVGELFHTSDLFVFPSRFEGYGMAAVEALYCGTPVVATDLPMIREGLGNAAQYVPYFTHAGDWVEAAASVLAERELWKAKALSRSAFLRQRQQEEIQSFVQFLRAL